MIKVTAILLVGLLGTMLMRRRSAALRHWVLAAAIMCAAATPLLETVAPVWRLPVVTSLFARPTEALALGDGPGRATWPGDGGTTSSVVGARRRPAVVLPALGWIWAIGVGVNAMLLVVGIGRLAWIASRARPVVRGTWATVSDTLSRGFALARPIRLLRSDHPTMLVTWGFRRPKVVLPKDANAWSEDRIRVVLGHELAHIRRSDWVVQLIAECVRCAYWFNPLVWIACRRLRQESERACDDAVLTLGVTAPEYASQLLDLARLFKQSRSSLFPAPAMARPSDLERRVRAMLNARLDRAPASRSACILALVGLVALTVPTAGLVLSPESAGPAAPAAPAAVIARPAAPVLPAASPRNAVTLPLAPAPRARAERPPVVAAPQAGAPATFAGTLTDQNGRTVPNVPVVLSNAVTAEKFEARTDEGGRFAFSGVPAGEYQFKATKPGFATYKIGVTLEAGRTRRQDVVLQLGMLSESVSVSAVAGPRPAGPVLPRAVHVGAIPTDDPCSQAVEGGCVTPPRKLADAKPVYPGWHMEAGVSGVVVIEGRLRTDGSVGDMQPAQGNDPDFAAAAMHAIRLWHFSPVRLNGVPVEVRIQVTVDFRIAGK